MSLLYIFFNKETISATKVNFPVEFTRLLPNMKTCVFIAVAAVVSLSGGRFLAEKACCLSSKTQEKNDCGDRMIGLSTVMARVAEVDHGNIVMKRESDWKSPKVLKISHMPSHLTAVKLWSTFSRILLQRIKHFWCKLVEISFFIKIDQNLVTWLICIF